MSFSSLLGNGGPVLSPLDSVLLIKMTPLELLAVNTVPISALDGKTCEVSINC